MKSYFKLPSLLMIITLFLTYLSFISCDKKESEIPEQLTPQALYQTSWRGSGHCKAWTVQDMSIGIQFIDTQKGKVFWEGYDEINITYAIEGKYMEFNTDALYLAGAPWVIKSYTKNHITLIQNEASPNKEEIAIIELDRVN